MRQTSARWLGVALIAALFLGGVGVGIAVDRIWLGGGGVQDGAGLALPRRLERFARRLELTPEQRDKVRDILEQSQSRIGRETAEARRKILEILTPEQAARYEQMIERRRHRRGRRRHRR